MGDMSGMPIEARFTNDPQAAVTDAAREDVGARLNQAYAAGELELVDYQRLLDQAFAAQHNADLVPVARALPARLASDQPAVGGDDVGAPGGLAPAGPQAELPERASAQRAALVVAGVLVVALVILALVLIL